MKIDYLISVLLCVITGVSSYGQSSTGASRTLSSSGYAAVNGLNVYYETHGEGEPVILLHGAYMTIDMNWSQVIPELASSRKVIALELQGHGRTADIARPFAYPSLASDVAGVMNHLNIDSATIIGYSFGGTVALQVAVQYPELVKDLVIISTVFTYDGWLPEAREAFASFQSDFFDTTPLKTAYDSLAPEPEHWHKFVEKLIKFDKEPFNLGAENIRSIEAPTLLVMGDNDGVRLQHKMEFYKLLGGDVFADMSGLPKSQLAIVPGATHVGVMDAGKIIPLIKPFLER